MNRNRRAADGTLIGIPDIERFTARVRQVFASGKLTNNGPLMKELEARLADHLQVPHLVLTSSGTLALQIAYRALGLSGEVITTPFSWIATASSLCWIGLRPKFVDIDPHSFNLDAGRIEAAITPQTSAILAVHSFGNPGNLEELEAIARRQRLRIIYDAAHAFGVRYRGESVLARGDASVLSLHATKLFHTIEGGAIAFRDKDSCERARLTINNGMNSTEEVQALGINGRMSELHAAAGLCLLERVHPISEHRAMCAERLRTLLTRSSGVRLQQLNPAARVNHAFFPVVFPNVSLREHAMAELGAAGIKPRRYFWPALNRLPFLGDTNRMPIAEDLSERILCVPLGPRSTVAQIEHIALLISNLCPPTAAISRL